jgi:MFS family permease
MKAESINALSNAALFGSLLLVPLFAEELGASPAEIGILVAAYSMSNLLASYIFGRLADVHGRKIFLILGLVLSSITCAIQYFAHDTMMLLATRIMLGFCAGIFPAALMAYAYESKGRMTRFLAWGSGGWGIGTMISGVVATYFTVREPFLFSALLMALCIPIAMKMRFRKEIKLSVSFFPVHIIKKNIEIYGPMLVRHTGACAIWVMFPMFIREMKGVEGSLFLWVGIMYAINSFSQFIFMRYLKYKSSVLIPWGMVASAATFILFVMCHDVWTLMATQVLLALSWALIYVGSVNFVMVNNKERATATGFLNSVFQISSILGALAGGFIVDATGDLLAPMWLAAVMSIIGLILYYPLRKNRLAKRAANVVS